MAQRIIEVSGSHNAIGICTKHTENKSPFKRILRKAIFASAAASAALVFSSAPAAAVQMATSVPPTTVQQSTNLQTCSGTAINSLETQIDNADNPIDPMPSTPAYFRIVITNNEGSPVPNAPSGTVTPSPGMHVAETYTPPTNATPSLPIAIYDPSGYTANITVNNSYLFGSSLFGDIARENGTATLNGINCNINYSKIYPDEGILVLAWMVGAVVLLGVIGGGFIVTKTVISGGM